MRNQARKVRNHQADLQHKTTTGVVHDAREIEVEGASSELLRQLEYKAEWHGRPLKLRRGPPKPATSKPPVPHRSGGNTRRPHSPDPASR